MMHAPCSAHVRADGGELRPAIISLLAALAIALSLPVGTACLPDRAKIPVVPPVVADGACCGVQDGLCRVLTSAGCGGLGSGYQYRGDGAPCTPNPCSIPSQSGACCNRLQDGACTLLTSADCQGRGGDYLYSGDGTVCSPSPCPPVLPAGAFIASGVIRTLGAGWIKTDSGARIVVPKFAVPRTPAGTEGEIAFSIERDPMSITPPAGRTKASDVYRIGPDGFVLSRPVKLTLPVLGDTANKSFILYRINQTTGKSEPYGGTFDKDSLFLSVQTYRFSPWYIASAPRANTAWGAIEVTNSSTDQWLNLCVEEYALEYGAPGEADADFRGDASSSWAPIGEIGVASHGLWFVPQGTYKICAEMRRAGTLSSPPGPAHHVILNDIQVSDAWTYSQPRTTPLTLSGLGPAALDSTCACTPVPTPSVGTGDIQITLTWHSAQAVDLDLWVTEPGGTQCYYGNPTTTTGGTLDIDNKCSNYVDGRPENIFWANAPAGNYKIEVKWYSDCSTGVASMPYDLRLVNGTTARTFTGTITPSLGTVEVTTFTVSPGRPVRFLPVGEQPASRAPMPPKE